MDAGIVTEERPLHPLNADSPITRTVEDISTASTLKKLKNALTPIEVTPAIEIFFVMLLQGGNEVSL